jgi:hypothetical protein
LNKLNDRPPPSRLSHVSAKLSSATVNQDPARSLLGFGAEAPQVVLKLSNVAHTGLVLLALDDDWNAFAVEQEYVEALPIGEDSLADLLVRMR